jgi:hyperosmotically inducible periplasmic protein
MKSTPLLALMLSAVFLAGCAGMDGTASPSAGTKAAGGAASASTAAATGDAAIAENVQKALAADPETKDLKISAVSTQGRVVLKGEVGSVATFQRIAAIARGVSGVTAVDNQVVVCMTCK